MTLLDWLISKHPAAKRQTLRRMLEAGRVTVNGRRARSAKTELTADDVVRVVDQARDEPRKRPARPAFAIVLEDADVLVIDKPVGLLTSTVPREPRPTALAAVTKYLAESDPAARVGLIHRLDRDASGLLVFSKNDDSFRSLKQQFFKHTVDRIYHAIVDGSPNPTAGRIETSLVERTDGSVHSAKHKIVGKMAITEYKTIRRSEGRSLVRVMLHTGRKHQIRVHLSEQGTPIVNDPMYSPRRRAGRLMLAATELSFDHPRTGKRVKLTLPLPGEMTALIDG